MQYDNIEELFRRKLSEIENQPPTGARWDKNASRIKLRSILDNNKNKQSSWIYRIAAMLFFGFTGLVSLKYYWYNKPEKTATITTDKKPELAPVTDIKAEKEKVNTPELEKVLVKNKISYNEEKINPKDNKITQLHHSPENKETIIVVTNLKESKKTEEFTHQDSSKAFPLDTHQPVVIPKEIQIVVILGRNSLQESKVERELIKERKKDSKRSLENLAQSKKKSITETSKNPIIAIRRVDNPLSLNTKIDL